jgi:hypothetical protein
MKKIILISIILFFAGLNGLMAQFANVNPIPTYNYQMTTGSAGFQEQGPYNQTREKRDMNIEVTTSSDAMMTEIFATVFIVKKNGTQILGPYTVYCDEILSVELPGGQWGVAVNCSWNVLVSVWIDKAQPRTL